MCARPARRRPPRHFVPKAGAGTRRSRGESSVSEIQFQQTSAHENGGGTGHASTVDVKAIRDAVERARTAQARWRLEPLPRRVEALRRAAKEMLRRRAEVITLAHEEMGKVEAEGLFNEAIGPLDTVNGWAAVVERATGRKRSPLNPIGFPRKSAYVDLVPRGVVGIIAPWNFPVASLYRPVFPALLTGNAIVVKP